MDHNRITLNNARLMAASVRIHRRVKNELDSRDRTGAPLISLFLDTILRDSCSPEVVHIFLEEIYNVAVDNKFGEDHG